MVSGGVRTSLETISSSRSIPSSNPSSPRSISTFSSGLCDLRDGVGTTGDGLVAALALPDTNSLALHGVLSAEGADVTCVLRNFGLLDLLTQRGTVSVEGRILGQYRVLSFGGRQFSFGISQSFGRSK